MIDNDPHPIPEFLRRPQTEKVTQGVPPPGEHVPGVTKPGEPEPRIETPAIPAGRKIRTKRR